MYANKFIHNMGLGYFTTFDYQFLYKNKLMTHRLYNIFYARTSIMCQVKHLCCVYIICMVIHSQYISTNFILNRENIFFFRYIYYCG